MKYCRSNLLSPYCFHEGRDQYLLSGFLSGKLISLNCVDGLYYAMPMLNNLVFRGYLMILAVKYCEIGDAADSENNVFILVVLILSGTTDAKVAERPRGCLQSSYTPVQIWTLALEIL